jgi:hypothetical protein
VKPGRQASTTTHEEAPALPNAAGRENRIPQLLPRHSWKRISPSAVWAVKSGARPPREAGGLRRHVMSRAVGVTFGECAGAAALAGGAEAEVCAAAVGGIVGAFEVAE